MINQETNLTNLLDDMFGCGGWENQLKNVLFESMYRNAINDDSTDNEDSNFIHTIYYLIENLQQDRKQFEKLGNLEVVTPSSLEITLLLES